MDITVVSGLLLLAGAVVSASLPRGHWLLAVLGLAGAFITGIVAWVGMEYADFEGHTWIALLLVVVYFGGGWSLGVGLGYLVRERLVRRQERLRGGGA